MMRYYDKDWASDSQTTVTTSPPGGGTGVSRPPSAGAETEAIKKRGLPVALKVLFGVLIMALLAGILLYFRQPPPSVVDPRKGTVFVMAGITNGTSKGVSFGSGVILSKEGVILTNKHVIMDGDHPSDHIVIRVNSGTPEFKDYPAERLDVSEEKEYSTQETMHHDWALLKIKATDLTALPIGESRPSVLKPESEVRAVGFPHVTLDELMRKQELKNGPQCDIAKGFISSFVPDESKPYCIVHSCPIQKGNSGGPLINAKGEVVGINTQFNSDTGGNHKPLAIAIHTLQNQLESQKIPFPK